MQKPNLSTSPVSKTINYFKYQIKDTNQLLKDFISCSIVNSSSQNPQNKQLNKNDDIFKNSIALRNIGNTVPIEFLKTLSHDKIIQSQVKSKEIQKNSLKYDQDLQNNQIEIYKDLINENIFTGKRKKPQLNSMEDLILQKFYYQDSVNQNNTDQVKPSIHKYKNREPQFTNDKYDQYKQLKKPRKGLANISLRVKNIVAQHKKLTYKQVSDYVLHYAKDQIEQLQPNQRVKQVKNIKRRVYDALNVLVAVGILGKHQRCVCTTQWTNVPGKRHSNEWQKINAKIQEMNALRKNCAQKSLALNQLIDKYHAITALRNKHLQQIKFEETNFQAQRILPLQSQNINPNQDFKLMFPVILFCPDHSQQRNDKLSIQIEQGDSQNNKNQNKKQKIKISGKNITILGDFDCAWTMNLTQYRDSNQQRKLIEEMQQFSKENTSKKNQSLKIQTDHLEEASIEDYFNDQMFQSK